MATVIALDFGDCTSYPSCIVNPDPGYPLGGEPMDLLPPSAQGGVPSVFFYNGNGGFLAGRAAVSGAAKPARNRIRCLKRSLGKPLTVDGKPVVIGGKTWTCDDAVREVVQSVLREANRELQHLGVEQTNLITLAYPADYSSGQRDRLVRIAESASAEGGARFKVVNTIPEPAAAAMEYLVQTGRTGDAQVLVVRLGDGLLEVALVSCYPHGKAGAGDSPLYYEIRFEDALQNTGGREFDEAVYQLLRAKLESALPQKTMITRVVDGRLRQNAEEIKRELTDSDKTVVDVYIPALDDIVWLELTREELESSPKTAAVLAQVTNKVLPLFEMPGLPRPDSVVLIGEDCRIPAVRNALVRALAVYEPAVSTDRECGYETAVSHGAARWGALGAEDTAGGKAGPGDRKFREVGIRYYLGADDESGFIVPLFRSGDKLPFTSPWAVGASLEDESNVTYELYDAVADEPDPDRPDRDYRLILTVTLDTGVTAQAGAETEVRLSVSETGLAVLEARECGSSRTAAAEYQLENLF